MSTDPAGQRGERIQRWRDSLRHIETELQLPSEGFRGCDIGFDETGNLIIFFQHDRFATGNSFIGRAYQYEYLPRPESAANTEEFLRLAFLGDLIPPWGTSQETGPHPDSWVPDVPISFWIGTL
ncbi:hypothetical protein GCM10011512_07720 [Tersicoccus solisilvae]|uniref:Uncharacterized protein n=1 Tax=Tersicoccus solisilvae TaxID=1882339 RepID=A0ABQ1NR98_9MICC|nr:hypothetical protein GCM10011512_07720 [Tersicoccus solisilvae]